VLLAQSWLNSAVPPTAQVSLPGRRARRTLSATHVLSQFRRKATPSHFLHYAPIFRHAILRARCPSATFFCLRADLPLAPQLSLLPLPALATSPHARPCARTPITPAPSRASTTPTPAPARSPSRLFAPTPAPRRRHASVVKVAVGGAVGVDGPDDGEMEEDEVTEGLEAERAPRRPSHEDPIGLQWTVPRSDPEAPVLVCYRAPEGDGESSEVFGREHVACRAAGGTEGRRGGEDRTHTRYMAVGEGGDGGGPPLLGPRASCGESPSCFAVLSRGGVLATDCRRSLGILAAHRAAAQRRSAPICASPLASPPTMRPLTFAQWRLFHGSGAGAVV